jgi:hypothetical protein
METTKAATSTSTANKPMLKNLMTTTTKQAIQAFLSLLIEIQMAH